MSKILSGVKSYHRDVLKCLKTIIYILQIVKFDLIRVESPLVLVINGKKAGSDFQAGIQLSTFTKSD